MVGGFLRIHISGAYMNVRMAIPNNIHSKPMVLTRVPLIAGPVEVTQQTFNYATKYLIININGVKKVQFKMFFEHLSVV